MSASQAPQELPRRPLLRAARRASTGPRRPDAPTSTSAPAPMAAATSWRSCTNTKGSRSAAPARRIPGNGYVGCFDVNECPNGDCTRSHPDRRRATAAPPVVTASGDVTVAAVSEAGAPATFTATASDDKDGVRQAYCLPRSGSTFRDRQDRRQLLGFQHARQARTHEPHGHGQQARFLTSTTNDQQSDLDDPYRIVADRWLVGS